MSQTLITRLLAVRESWFEIEPGKRIKLRRPAETEMPEMRHGITVEHLTKIAVDWEGITDADLFGATVGSDAAVPFSPAVFQLVVADRSKWFNAIATEVMRLVAEHLKAKAETEKN